MTRPPEPNVWTPASNGANMDPDYVWAPAHVPTLPERVEAAIHDIRVLTEMLHAYNTQQEQLTAAEARIAELEAEVAKLEVRTETMEGWRARALASEAMRLERGGFKWPWRR